MALGAAQQRAGRLADARATFVAATTLDASPSTGTDAWFGVSATALSLDRVDEADAAMARLQSIDPGPGRSFSRALHLWNASQYARVVEDVQALLDMEDSEPDARAYPAFIGALAAQRLNQPDVAATLLARAESPELSTWTRTVMAYLRGAHSDREFLSKARGVGQETEAHAYIGVTASLAGRRDDALLHLGWVRDRGAHNYTEYPMARTELARLEATGLAVQEPSAPHRRSSRPSSVRRSHAGKTVSGHLKHGPAVRDYRPGRLAASGLAITS